MTENEYWVLSLNGMVLVKGKNGPALSKSLKGAVKFQDQNSAMKYAYGDRPMRGDTKARKVRGSSITGPFGEAMPANKALHLGLELTSCLENSSYAPTLA